MGTPPAGGGSDEVATIPLEERNASGGRGDVRDGADDRSSTDGEKELAEGLDSGENLSAGLGSCGGLAEGGGIRTGSFLHATGGVATITGHRALTELADLPRRRRPVREHQREAEEDGNKGFHLRLV